MDANKKRILSERSVCPGRVARAYSSLRRRERDCPRLSRAFRLRFFFVPVRRDPPGNGLVTQFSVSPLKSTQVRRESCPKLF